MSTASRKISKRQDKRLTNRSPSKPSNSGNIRQFFSSAKNKTKSAKDSQADVDRVEVERGNDMSIRDLQDLHIDLDRGLCESVCFTISICQLCLLRCTKGLDGRE